MSTAAPSPPYAFASVVPVIAFLAVLYSWLLIIVNQMVPDPYMVNFSRFLAVYIVSIQNMP